jgi:catechol 2,3-dioxygenase-like lactoylglutathione lyase family enzyme
VFVQFAELPVFDQDRAKRFYVDHFHCQVVADVPMNKDGWRWLELKFPGAETALHFLRRPDETPSKDPVLVFVAEDVEADGARARIERSDDRYEAGPGPPTIREKRSR